MNVTLKDIRLSFSYKEVLKGVNLEFTSGKIHALLGENGAGKSSLMKILSGAIKPHSGKILLDDFPVVFNSPKDSLKHKIACVYQRPYLSDSLSVEENLKLNRRFFYKSFSRTELVFFDNINLKAKARTLLPSQRFYVALNSALLRNPSVLILDEPTALLDDKESEALFLFLKKLSKEGMNIIVITHKKKDLSFCSDYVYLNEGSVLLPETSEPELSDEVLRLEKKEILSAEKCMALRKKHNGSRVGIIPSDRTYLASNPNLTVEQLLCMGYEGNWKLHAAELINKSGVNIKPFEKARSLSGGMLQRLILERELWGNPEFVYIEDGYQGLDSVSCERLRKRLLEAEQSGVKIINL